MTMSLLRDPSEIHGYVYLDDIKGAHLSLAKCKNSNGKLNLPSTGPNFLAHKNTVRLCLSFVTSIICHLYPFLSAIFTGKVQIYEFSWSPQEVLRHRGESGLSNGHAFTDMILFFVSWLRTLRPLALFTGYTAVIYGTCTLASYNIWSNIATLIHIKTLVHD